MKTMKHPTEAGYEKHPLTDQKFWKGKLEEGFFNLWATWFSQVFRTDVTADQAQAICMSLQRIGFTNEDFQWACEEIEAKRRVWPFISDFCNTEVLGDKFSHKN